MNIKYSEAAVKDLKNFDPPERTLIAKRIEYLADNFEDLKATKKIRELKGSKFGNQYRFTIARKIRALFTIIDDEIVLLILRVGLRKDIYE